MALVDVLEKQEVETGIQTWNLDGSHSSAAFSVKHMMIANVRGQFDGLSGSLQLDANRIEDSNVQITIDAASISTHDEKRDGHLKSADFFDVEQYPEITFRSTKFEKKSEDELLVKGDLTIHGITREVILSVDGPSDQLADPWGGRRVGFSGTTKINRKDFGLVWNVALEAGGVLVGEDVKLSFDAQFVRA
jgi:polyisoprenoid-binding protein YceI